MYPRLSDLEHKILQLLYHYGFIWPAAIQNFLDIPQSTVYYGLSNLMKSKHGLIHRKLLQGESRKQTYALTEEGFQYLKQTYDFPSQFIEDRDLRFENLSDGYIRHECLVSLVASTFQQYAAHRAVHDRRAFISHLPAGAKEARARELMYPMEIRTAAGSHRVDDVIYFEEAGQRPKVLLIEIDRGTESARDRYGRPRGKVSKMFQFFLDGYKEKFYKEYFGKDVKPIVLFVISTPWSGETRKQNFIDLWSEVGQGQALDLPRFVTIEKFAQADPYTLLSAGDVAR